MHTADAAAGRIEIRNRLCCQKRLLECVGRGDVWLAGALTDGNADAGTGYDDNTICCRFAVLDQAIYRLTRQDNHIGRFAFSETSQDGTRIGKPDGHLIPSRSLKLRNEVLYDLPN